MSVPGDRTNDWNQDPERLTQEIDATREDVGETLEALQQKLSPSQLFDQSVNYLGERGYDLAYRFGDVVRRHPVPFAIGAAGLIWLAMRRRSRDEYMLVVEEDEDDFMGTAYETGSYSESGLYDETAGSYAGNGEEIGDASSALGSARQKVRSAASSARSRASSAAHSVSDRASRVRGSAGRKARRAGDEFTRLMHEQPLLIGAIGIAVGAAIAALIPMSNAEDRLFGDASERLMQRARQKTGEQVQRVRETARRAAEGAREGARRAVSESQQQTQSSGSSSGSGYASGPGSYTGGATGGNVSAGMGATSSMSGQSPTG